MATQTHQLTGQTLFEVLKKLEAEGEMFPAIVDPEKIMRAEEAFNEPGVITVTVKVRDAPSG